MDEIKELRKRVLNLRHTPYVRQLAEMATKVTGIKKQARTADKYDRNRHLLAVANGVLDLKEMIHREARREDLLTVASPAAFVEGSTCPAFDKFLHRALAGDDDLISYWWRIVGYSLTGYVDHDALFFCYGTGANGKSTANLTLQMLLGDGLSCVVNVHTLLGSGQDSAVEYRKAMLEGKRLVITDELPDGKALNEATVKALLGGEDIQARRPYEKPYNFSPTHKIWMVGNHKPRIAGTDHGIWRRIHLIPWVVTIPPAERRPRHELLAAFRAELSGILSRAIDGYNDFLDRGNQIDPPKAVLQATDEYRQEEDHIGHFLRETLREAPGKKVFTKEVFTRYRQWCDANGEKQAVMTSAKMVRVLKTPPYSLTVEAGAQRSYVLWDRTWIEDAE